MIKGTYILAYAENSHADTISSLFNGISSKFKKEMLRFHDKSLKHRNCFDHQKVLENPQSSSI